MLIDDLISDSEAVEYATYLAALVLVSCQQVVVQRCQHPCRFAMSQHDFGGVCLLGLLTEQTTEKAFFFFFCASCADETTLLLSNLLFSTIFGTSVVNLE